MVIFDEGYSYCKCFEPRFPPIPQETYSHIKQELGTWEIGSVGVKIQLFIVIYLSVCHLQYTQFIHQYE